MASGTNLCRVCDCELKDGDQRFIKSVGMRAYFDVTCSTCGAQYACDETGSLVRFRFAEVSDGLHR